MSAGGYRSANTSVLAYMGDAVYEVRIRRMLVENGRINPDAMHREAIRYVSAEGQSRAVSAMLADGYLTEDEVALVKRARNHRISSHPRHSDPRDYKLATGLEALVGYLFLEGQIERVTEIVDEAVRIIECEEQK